MGFFTCRSVENAVILQQFHHEAAGLISQLRFHYKLNSKECLGPKSPLYILMSF
jgi:hypothetical protein